MTRCIIVVAMANSVHTLRWLHMVANDRYRLVLLPCTNQPASPEIAALPRVRNASELGALEPGQICVWGEAVDLASPGEDRFPLPIGWRDPSTFVSPATIERAVRALRPDLVHSLELQHASYRCLAAATAMGNEFPPWLASNWGSDLYLYRKLDEHRPVLKALLRRIDALHGECQRDGVIARELGYPRERPLYVMPASGGVDFQRLPVPQQPPSARSTILVKGYHGWSGRAQHVLSALLLAAPRLSHKRVRLVLAGGAVAAMAREVARVTGLDVQVEPWSDDSSVSLQRIADARIAIGIGISDGIGTSFLEAMALGAFPIAATTGCLCEWIREGVDGLVVDPHDTYALAKAISRAANEDSLVDAAAVRNRGSVQERWNVHTNRMTALNMYRITMVAVDEQPRQ